MMKGVPGRWGLGFQLGDCADSGGRRVAVLGHLGSGGNLGLCVPKAGISLGITVSRLSSNGVATSKLIDLLLADNDLHLKEFAVGAN